MSSSNCYFLTCIEISQEADQVVWYSHFLKNFPQFIVIHTVKGFGIVNKAEIDVFLELACFFNDSENVGNLISGSSAFLKPPWTSGSSWFTYCWSLTWRILSITLLVCEMSAWQPTPILLPGESHGWRSLVGYSPWVAKTWTRLSNFPFTFHFPALEKEMATHSSILAWRIPGTEEPVGLPSVGSHRVRHDWCNLAAAAGKHGRRQWHPTPVLLPGKSHGWRSLVGCSP